MSTSAAFLELLVCISMALAAGAIAVGLGAWWTRDERPPPVAESHAVRNVSEAWAAFAVATMIAAMVFVLIPILFVLTPFLVLIAWTLLEPPPYERYV